MKRSDKKLKPMPRRRFVQVAASGLAGSAVGAAAADDASPAPSLGQAKARQTFELRPIGVIEVQGERYRLRLEEEFKEGLLGMSEWSHVVVLYWLDKNDTPEGRRRLQVHPRGNRENPLTGVFACRSPFRPNLIAMSVCKIVSVKGALVEVDKIDAFDGSPLLDLKPFTPRDAPPLETVRVPAWARKP